MPPDASLPALAEVAREIGDTNGPTVAVGVASLAILLPLRYVAPRVPAAGASGTQGRARVGVYT